MKKLFLMAVAFGLVVLCMAGCSDNELAVMDPAFEVVEEISDRHGHYAVLKHKETGVHYLWCGSGYRGGLTVLVDADGTPYMGGEEE